jgi:hypothetical protein
MTSELQTALFVTDAVPAVRVGGRRECTPVYRGRRSTKWARSTQQVNENVCLE